jgi:hypothetical protein
MENLFKVDPKAGLPGNQLIQGLTKREYFAAMAMQGYITNAGYSIDEDARLAVQAADALIKALNEPQP